MEKDKSQNNPEETKRCGHGSGHCCCSLKAIGAILLILIGWMVGFLMGSHGGFCGKGKRDCDYSMSGMSGCPMIPGSKEQTPPKTK